VDFFSDSLGVDLPISANKVQTLLIEMALSVLKPVLLLALLTIVFNCAWASNTSSDQMADVVSTTDSLYLPPLDRYLGKEVQVLLADINPDNYEKFFIGDSSESLNGIIIRFKVSGAAMYIYFIPSEVHNIGNISACNWERVKKERIARIEIYNDQELVTRFYQH